MHAWYPHSCLVPPSPRFRLQDMKRVTLECGGNDPAIVRPDADIASAAKGSLGGLGLRFDHV